MAQYSNSEKLLRSFLEAAKSHNNDVQPIQILRAHAFKIGKANVRFS